MLRRILFILTVPAMVLTPHARAVSEIAAKRIAVTSGALVCPFAPVKVSRHPTGHAHGWVVMYSACTRRNFAWRGGASCMGGIRHLTELLGH